MSAPMDRAVARRSAELKTRLRRHKLVYVQCGANFSVFRDALLSSVPDVICSAREFADTTYDTGGTIMLTELEKFAQTGSSAKATLGELRMRVYEELDKGTEVCLLSYAPRSRYFAVPGSSLIEDASVYYIPLLEASEIPVDKRNVPEAVLPTAGLRGCEDLNELFCQSLRELGVQMLAALDHAIFEAKFRQDFIALLDPRDLEALRGAGLLVVDGVEVAFSVPRRLGEFREAVASVLAEAVEAPVGLAQIAEGLWFIERAIRRKLREAAITKFSGGWRKMVLKGDLNSKVLERARDEGSVGAASVAELRDPIEWLTLGELLAVVRSRTFAGLAFDEVAWRRFDHDILPVRNRLAHMRLIKKGDKETVAMWVARVRESFR